MTTPKDTYNKTNFRLPKSIDYRWDILMGGFLTSMMLISLGAVILMKLNLTVWLYPLAALCVILVSYYQWRDDNLTSIQTGLSKEDNYTLAANCLDNLDWHYAKFASRIDLQSNKYILKFIHPTIIPESDRILINFKYHSTSKTGRLPFFFGISTYLKWKFKRALNKTLLQKDKSNLVDNTSPEPRHKFH